MQLSSLSVDLESARGEASQLAARLEVAEAKGSMLTAAHAESHKLLEQELQSRTEALAHAQKVVADISRQADHRGDSHQEEVRRLDEGQAVLRRELAEKHDELESLKVRGRK